jgi:PAS domain S-box-containing protein
MSKNIKNFKHLSGLFIIFAVVLSLSLIVVESQVFGGDAQRLAIDNAVKKSIEREEVLKEFINHSKKDLKILKQLVLSQDYINNDKLEQKLEDIFVAYAKANSSFMQLRFIDKNGLEKIRVNRSSQNGLVSLVPKNKLQDKANRYYFKNAKTKNQDQVSFSAIDLNIENGMVEVPYKTTLRAILPIQYNEQFSGLLVINYFMQDFITKLTHAPLYDMILYDNSGYVVYHYSYEDGVYSKCFGNSLEHRYNIHEAFPYHYKKMLSSDFVKTDTFVSKKFDVDIYGGLNIILQLKESYVENQQDRLKNKYFWISAVVFILLIILIYILTMYGDKLMNISKINELSESLHTISSVAKIGFWEYDAKTEKIKLNQSLCKIFELDEISIELHYEKMLEYIDEEDRKSVQDRFDKSIENLSEYFVTHKITTAKGNIKVLEQRGKHYFDKDGNFTKTVGSIYDITNTHTVSQKYKLILENSSDAIFLIDLHGRLVEFSNKSIELFGYTKEELKKLTVYDIDKQLTKHDFENILQTLEHTSMSFERVNTKKDGSTFMAQINASLVKLNGETFIYASNRDVSRQKQYEKLIIEKNKEQKSLLSLFDKGDNVLFKWNNDDTWSVNYVSDNVENLLGYTKEEFLEARVSYSDIILDEDLPRVLEEVNFAKVSNLSFSKHRPYRVKTKDNTEKWVLDHTLVIRDEDARITHYLGYLVDITEQVSTQEKLKDSQLRWKFAIEGNKDGLWEWNIKTNEVFYSKQYKEMLGYKLHEVGRTLDEYDSRLHEDDKEDVYQKIQECLDGKVEYYSSEHRVQCKDGTYKWVLDRGVVLSYDKDNKPLKMVGTFTDITHMKNITQELKDLNETLEQRVQDEVQKSLKLEQDNFQYQKKAAMGDLIGIIAHQLKQPLNAISLSKEVIVLDYEDQLLTQESIDEFDKSISNQIDFMANSIDELRNFFRPNKNKECMSIKVPINKSLSIIEKSITSKGILLIKEFEDDLYINCIESELQQVIINIITNAKDAILDKNIQNPFIKIGTKLEIINNDENVVLSIEDNAGGIDSDIMDKIFDSYFTTKGASGTGIGLNLAKMIIEDSLDGTIYVENSDFGAKFVIKLKSCTNDTK